MASGFRRVETFLFSSKLSARGRSFRFRSSFAFNEDPAEYSETPRRALLYTQVPVSFCPFEREREKKENKKEQKGGEELGRLINFLITVSSTDSLSFFFFVSSCYYIPWTSKKKEEKRAEY